MNATDTIQNWKIRYFSILIGQGLSFIGSAVTQFVLLWWIADTTGSVSSLATAGLFGLLPQAILSPFAGTFADRNSRRLIMIASDAVSAICIAILIPLFLSDHVELWHIYAMMFVRSTMQAFQQPAMNATTPLLVPHEFIPRAAALNQIVGGVVALSSPILGALAMAIMPFGYALGIDIVTSLFGIAPLLFFAIPQEYRDTTSQFRVDLVEGFGVVWNNAGLRMIYGLIAFNMLLVAPLIPLMPLLVRDHFDGGPPQVALLQTASGAGFILGGLIVIARPPQRRAIWFLNGSIVSSIGLGMIGAPPSNGIVFAALAFGIASVTYVGVRASITALIQLNIPNQLQGRVFSLLGTVDNITSPIGLILVTPVAAHIGIRAVYIGVGLITCLANMAGHLSESARDLDMAGIQPQSVSPVHTEG